MLAPPTGRFFQKITAALFIFAMLFFAACVVIGLMAVGIALSDYMFGDNLMLAIPIASAWVLAIAGAAFWWAMEEI